ncbi:MAG: hypothetical protein OXP09_22580 [Gammaproteobacteria bacterium]|nr:hypothetical protein [Gammaproteobacteria bacterium]
MNQSRSSADAKKRVASIERAVAAVRNASQCVCEGCDGTITGSGFVETPFDPPMWHEECFDNRPILDVHRTPEGHYAFSLVPPDAGEELMAVRISEFATIRNPTSGSPTQDPAAEPSPDPQDSPSKTWRTALAEALAKAERIGEQLRLASFEPSNWPVNIWPEEDRRGLLFESQEAAAELPRAIGEVLRLFDDASKAWRRRPDDVTNPENDKALKGLGLD